MNSLDVIVFTGQDLAPSSRTIFTPNWRERMLVIVIILIIINIIIMKKEKGKMEEGSSPTLRALFDHKRLVTLRCYAQGDVIFSYISHNDIFLSCICLSVHPSMHLAAQLHPQKPSVDRLLECCCHTTQIGCTWPRSVNNPTA